MSDISHEIKKRRRYNISKNKGEHKRIIFQVENQTEVIRIEQR